MDDLSEALERAAQFARFENQQRYMRWMVAMRREILRLRVFESLELTATESPSPSVSDSDAPGAPRENPPTDNRFLDGRARLMRAQSTRAGGGMDEEPSSGATDRRLCKLQQSSHVERLLQALVVNARLVPRGACQVTRPDAIPTDLRRLAALAVRSGHVWSCWTHDSHTWLATAEMPLPLSRERGAPVLQVDVYDENGPQHSALWMPSRDGRWNLCSGAQG